MSHALSSARPKAEPAAAGPASCHGGVRRLTACFVMACSVRSSPDGRPLAARSYKLAVAPPRPAHPLHMKAEAPLD
jgi:hypothetical protein